MAISLGFNDFGDEHKGRAHDHWVAKSKSKGKVKKASMNSISWAAFADEFKKIAKEKDKEWSSVPALAGIAAGAAAGYRYNHHNPQHIDLRNLRSKYKPVVVPDSRPLRNDRIAAGALIGLTLGRLAQGVYREHVSKDRKKTAAVKCSKCGGMVGNDPDNTDMAYDGKAYCQDCAPQDWKQDKIAALFSPNLPHVFREKARGGGMDELTGFSDHMNRLAGL